MADLIRSGENPHLPVLYHEIIHALQPIAGGFYVDGTVGAGGHAWGILQASMPDGLLLGLDVDPQALALAGERLAEFGQRATLIRASYTTLGEQLDRLGWNKVNGIVLDLGASSMQFDTPERGFSFRVDAPLDMRFDPESSLRAADLVNTLPEAELANLLFRYGEERRARQIAQAIVNSRPVETTGELADIVLGVMKTGHRSESRRPTHIHPATRTFQALRIAVNRELDALEMVLPQAVTALAVGGRLAVIAFHSLEDRIVKQFFRRESQGCLCPPRQPVCTCGHKATLVEVVRRPLQPQPAELQQNPRARSARLRIAEKIS
ncbi:MAG: 16S rRNA (cytosine(1402)-N(4))-methyltransferase RsmH [Chloroflexota bacterium]